MSLLTEKELIGILKVSKIYLYQCRKRGLPYIRIGAKLIRYKLEDVLEWFEKNGGDVA